MTKSSTTQAPRINAPSYKPEWEADRKAALRHRIDFASLSQSPAVAAFGVGTDGQRYVVLPRSEANPARLVAALRKIEATADAWRSVTTADVLADRKAGCTGQASLAEPMAAARRKLAAEIDAWMALGGDVEVACPWRGYDWCVPVEYTD